jgi:hypothetical protein
MVSYEDKRWFQDSPLDELQVSSTPKHNLYFFVYYNPPDKTLYS